MLDRGEEGHIVNVASLAGIVGGGGVKDNRITVGDGKPELGAMYGYMATKHAVVAISEVLAGDLSGSPIGVSVLLPSHHENTNIYENSARFRPAAAGGPMSDDEIAKTWGNTDQKREEAYGDRKRVERFPDEAGARVVRAIRDGHFYVITHAETRPAIEHRFAQIMAAYDDAAAFTRGSSTAPRSPGRLRSAVPPVWARLRFVSYAYARRSERRSRRSGP